MSKVVVADAVWTNPPTRRDLQNRLERLPLSADAKVLMAQLLDTTVDVAGRIMEVGRRILSFVLEMMKRHPATALGAIVGLTVTMLVGSVPLLGVVLGPVVGPLLTAFMISQGALTDMRNSSLGQQIELFGTRLDAALTRD
ncbi:hypothetical protein PK98_15630 [Croceibacterium mercuriale]|uniref:Uncharacterized protein n=1 Tax=Croceibacterium mercuriale TaxID=1572751 RepID=A0A0B2BWB1_9SPHN|nr:hypothetical protein [Croceibacterium mercuriale]KHL24112.1 hypothetical protein PK98_15630 [Croceibacterium mercuriale]